MNQSYDNFIISAIKDIPKNAGELIDLKKRLSKKYQLQIPSNADMRDHYEEMIKRKKVKRNLIFEKSLLSRRIRTQSGVAVVAVLTKSYPCPGNCIFCPTEKDMPKSYLSNEPAVMRAISSSFDPYLQVQNRIRSLELNGHSTDKIELIVMGGTFSYLPKNYQRQFIAECFRGANDYPKKKKNKKNASWEFLFKEQKRNEKTKNRIIGLTLETRPDYIDEKEILNFRKLGATRVELGVQSIYDDILKLNKRGHSIKKTIEATKLLKNSGFKINYHMMPGLLGSSPAKDVKMFKELFENPLYQPDMLKIYPTVVTNNSQLYKVWKKGQYKPLSDISFEKILLNIKKNYITPYVRIARVVRDVPVSSIEAGPIISNLRQIIAHKSQCQCIRCREVREGYSIKERIVLDRIDYDASGGKEIFLQYVSPDKKKLFAMLRLRIPSSQESSLPVLRNAAIIREVHTYGKLAKISKKDNSTPQHIGLGKKLLLEAEKITQGEFGYDKIVVISGIGVRDYYRKLGYKLQETYMVKKLNN